MFLANGLPINIYKLVCVVAIIKLIKDLRPVIYRKLFFCDNYSFYQKNISNLVQNHPSHPFQHKMAIVSAALVDEIS